MSAALAWAASSRLLTETLVTFPQCTSGEWRLLLFLFPKCPDVHLVTRGFSDDSVREDGRRSTRDRVPPGQALLEKLRWGDSKGKTSWSVSECPRRPQPQFLCFFLKKRKAEIRESNRCAQLAAGGLLSWSSGPWVLPGCPAVQAGGG